MARCSGFTLTELVVTIGIITLILGAGAPALTTLMARNDASSPLEVLTTVQIRNVEMARAMGSGLVIYGLSIQYTGSGSTYQASTVIPWVSSSAGGGPSLTFTYAPYSNPLAEFPGTLPLEGNGFSIASGKVRLSHQGAGSNGISFTTGGTTTKVNTSDSSSWLHIACEPRTGFTHAEVTTSSTPNGIDTTTELAAQKPKKIELWLRTVASQAYSHRLVIFQNGSTGVQGP